MPEEYYCKKHHSNDGYINHHGNWQCWKCYRENKYYNYNGELLIDCVIEGTVKTFHIRIIAVDTREIILEVWQLKPMLKLVSNMSHQYFSQAMRDYEGLYEDYKRTANRKEVKRPRVIHTTRLPTNAEIDELLRPNPQVANVETVCNATANNIFQQYMGNNGRQPVVGERVAREERENRT